MEEHYSRYDIQPELSYSSVNLLWKLHKDDPYYWNPVRLANIFDCDAVEVRAILWDRKLAQEAEKAGDLLMSNQTFSVPWKMLSKEEIRLANQNKIRWEFDDSTLNASVPGKQCYPNDVFKTDGHVGEPTILKDRDWTRDYGLKDAEKMVRHAHGVIFGEKSVKKDFRMRPPTERKMKSLINTWHYIPSGASSKELLTYIRSYYSRRTVESPRIPPRQVDPPVSLKHYCASGGRSKEGIPKYKSTYIDMSPCYHLYNRPFHIWDENGYWRTATWDERRIFHDQKRDIKLPPREEDMIIYPDEDMPDHMAVSHIPPDWYPFHLNEDNNDEFVDLDDFSMGEEEEKREEGRKDEKEVVDLEEKRRSGGNVIKVGRRMKIMYNYVNWRKYQEEMRERNRFSHGKTLIDEGIGGREDNPWRKDRLAHIESDDIY